MMMFTRKISQEMFKRPLVASKYLKGHKLLPSSGRFSYSMMNNHSPKTEPRAKQLTKDFNRSFVAMGRGSAITDRKDVSKTKYVKPIDVNSYKPVHEPVILLENGYYLLYYHRQKTYTMFLLYLRYIIPIIGLIYLIKKNPFYKSYPIMLPVMFIALFTVIYRCGRYSSRTNKMIHQILIDPTGTEATFVYKNRFIRKLRNDNLEETFLIKSLMNPPQGTEYVPLRGMLFPEKYPFRFELLSQPFYFWLKYYTSQNNVFAIAKNSNYINYEIL